MSRNKLQINNPYIKQILKGEWGQLFKAITAVIINAIANVAGPYILGIIVDDYIEQSNTTGLIYGSLLLVGVYIIVFITSYYQIILMGNVGQSVLFKLRKIVFEKIQELDMQFFNKNKSGDLISRINNDTDNINTLFSETLVRLMGNIFTVTAIAVFIVILNPKLGFATIGIAAGLIIITTALSKVTQKLNKKSLEAAGEYSAEVQENLQNFKAIVAFNRQKYFTEKLSEINTVNFKAKIKAEIANSFTIPLYNFGGEIAQLTVLVYGIFLISQGEITIGLLISFLAYTARFFQPIRILASLWNSIQKSLAAWNRVMEILQEKPTLHIVKNNEKPQKDAPALAMHKVSFEYEKGKKIIHDVSIEIKEGKTVALVGPTGGGKSTLASLLTRLYDTTSGTITLFGKNIQTYARDKIAQNISFILQEPILFTGTVGENISFAHPDFPKHDHEKLKKLLKKENLTNLLNTFPEGLDTEIQPGSEDISIGQKQIIAFIRAILRKPRILILDEATANIDTVTEQELEDILAKLPKKTTKIIIAHRLNTIKKADEIIFVNQGTVTPSLTFEDALELIQSSNNRT